ncbi:2OG-Fe dioxygenase family protein [Vibrio sp. Isolate25]|uniref:2OG-Fe dioxygenase family protein n=1 Tax=Vibrio TaxID=662 RepID=UPI001EFEC4A1|nr:MULTISPECIES: 2OG-Fe dioxygenase family protein [Vibrio]MCG9596950.1 2OG-Fe dioxygenase family protein [Vibrio sp. Isolate25]MCG9679889.1 2OG-Fe dioxygenase family protein [Vibrio sp. Isolate24]MCG9682564.1 2OG-Fe dioxygenase family protein [Vibrio sp. Isolate23]USD34020.1 2OG-Fe dioxygenase family protein [Vibrio sp. SCSIO 43186]USD47089.1 2OG-Fe dioxygenase family protein [Vibrio sp. SCSIO 43145]
MLHNRETTLQLTQLSDSAFAQLAPSFTKLPNTEHADGQYRLRRYSVIQFKDGQVIDLQKNEFMQTDDINRFQGNVVRQFEPIEATTLQSEGMREICQLFVDANKLIDGQEIEIHQMRISAIFDETQVAPEGVHQDGFDHIALVGMGRHNIEGGDVMLYSSFNEAPFFRKVLQNGEVAMLADNKLWHNATPIRSVIEGEEGYMDVFVLTAKEAVNELHS